jgi:hypothetical protein
MSMYLYRNGQRSGPHNIDHVRAWLAAGQISPTDLGCYAGSNTWVPLHALLGAVVYLPPAQSSGGGQGAGCLLILGIPLMLFGALLSFTFFGAIIGLPLFLIGLILTICGRVQYNRSVMEQMSASVRNGIVQGMQPYAIPPPPQFVQPMRPPALVHCTACGEVLSMGASFCGRCGTRA